MNVCGLLNLGRCLLGRWIAKLCFIRYIINDIKIAERILHTFKEGDLITMLLKTKK